LEVSHDPYVRPRPRPALVAAPLTLAFAQGDVGINPGLIAIGAGIAIGVSAIATAMAMGAIGSAGVGALVERPQAFGQILIYLVIPETIIIFGFVIAFLLNGQVG
jgi:V/A-type H+/Na+-transporting ATPase subunit K